MRAKRKKDVKSPQTSRRKKGMSDADLYYHLHQQVDDFGGDLDENCLFVVPEGTTDAQFNRVMKQIMEAE